MLYMPREEGQGLVEYALILVLVAVVVIVILALLGPAIGNISATSFPRCNSIASCNYEKPRPLRRGFSFVCSFLHFR
jgi:pilus assembly protein Flp/PilA